MMNSNHIIEPNYTVKALVPYIGTKNIKKKSIIDKIEFLFENAYLKRFKFYYAFLAVAFIIAVLVGEVFSRYPTFSQNYADNLLRDYNEFGFSVKFLFNNFFSHGLIIVLAFLAGFTVFSLPVSVICFSRITLSAFYVFSSVLTSESFGIFHAFSLVLLFSVFVFISVLFFTETSIYYGVMFTDDSYIVFLRYIFVFISYIVLSPCILYLGMKLILPH